MPIPEPSFSSALPPAQPGSAPGGPTAALRVSRDGARLDLASPGRALTEAEARAHSLAHLQDGERLLVCIARDGTDALSYHFTFVVLPRMQSHTGSLLRSLRAA